MVNTELEQGYRDLIRKWDLQSPSMEINVNGLIKKKLDQFLSLHTNVAIYGNGYHTKMLMSDFMYELKSIRYIIDNYASECKEEGFFIIREKQLEQYKVDGVIISSYLHRSEMKNTIAQGHPGVACLDIYNELEEQGFCLKSEYYAWNHPYHHYRIVCEWNQKLQDAEEKLPIYRNLLQEHLRVKDFQSAQKVIGQMIEEFPDEDRFVAMKNDIDDFVCVYENTIRQISEDHVLMLCIDGLRREDLSEEYMPQLMTFCKKRGKIFTKAYSFSTSTYESLIPVYSENDDLRTRYYESNVIEEGQCRMVSEAVKQARYIYFDTDMSEYVQSDLIDRSSTSQTVSEKIWSFVVRAATREQGLFYMHVLFESHYSFVSPYTVENMICEGTAMLFDFLPKNGGKLRTDYIRQHKEALRYVDDQLSVMLENLSCRMVIYADHGNLLLPVGARLLDVKRSKLVADEEWIRIPLVIIAPEIGTGENGQLISLMEINNIVVALMKKQKFVYKDKDFIKAARSAIYNPDFKVIYKAMGYEQGLSAFEAFIFKDGYKLIIFENKKRELYFGEQDQMVEDELLLEKYFEQISRYITVYEMRR